MPATFQTTGSFEIPGRHLFVVHGSILSGVVKKGMTMKLGLNSSIILTMPIDAVELLKGIKDSSEIALCTNYKDSDEVEFLKCLNIGNEVIEIED